MTEPSTISLHPDGVTLVLSGYAGSPSLRLPADPVACVAALRRILRARAAAPHDSIGTPAQPTQAELLAAPHVAALRAKAAVAHHGDADALFALLSESLC